MKSDYIHLILGLSLLLFIISCKREKQTFPDTSNIPVHLHIDRFEREYHSVHRENFSKLKRKYPFFFPGDKPDEDWLAYPKDSLWNALYEKTDSLFADFIPYKKPLENLFKNVKYYYPAFKEPHIITMISLLDMEYQVIYRDTLLILSLDTFLGKNSPFYAHYAEYLRREYDPARIPLAVARKIAEETAPKIPYRRFLDKMISAGKIHYATHLFLPGLSERELFAYDDKKWQWATENEANIWSYFIRNEMLYSTDKDLAKRFIDKAPFSKFYKAFDNETPGSIGTWIGYRIIKSYVEHTHSDLPRLMATPPETIFKKSHYKPVK